MEAEKVTELIKKIFEDEIPSKFPSKTEQLTVIDAFAQFAQNPTSMSAGYGIEENYRFIKENLSKRYNLDENKLKIIENFLRNSIEDMRKVDYDVYLWRDVVKSHIKGNYAEIFLEWFTSLYERLNDKDKHRFLFLLYSANKASHYSFRDFLAWYNCFFDESEGTTEFELKELLIKFGLGNILYYRSKKGNVEYMFVPFILLDKLHEEFKDKIPTSEENVRDYFNKLQIADVKLLELCLKKEIPILETRIGKITQSSPLIVSTSRSFSAISPFAVDELRELVKSRKMDLTKDWKETLQSLLNSFVEEVFPLAELKVIFELEGSYCWELRYTESPDDEPISVGILLSPYIFRVSQYSTILDEMRNSLSTHLNIVLLIKETLPAIAESFKYEHRRTLIFLLIDNMEKKFYVMEKGELTDERKEHLIDSFLSRFLQSAEKKIQISRTWPMELKDYLENLKYYKKFPKLVEIRNRIPRIELALRKCLRERLERVFGDEWKEVLKKRMSKDVEKFERVIGRRLDKEDVKDFLDGATLGELVKIFREFYKELALEKNDLVHFDTLTQYRKIFEHPIKELESDIDEKTYRKIKLSMEYINQVLCSN